MSSVRARAARAALVATLLLVAAPGRAEAVGSVAPAANGLRESRLYIASAVAETIDTRSRRRLARSLAGRGEPIFVALVAFAPGDRFDGDGPRFLTALAGRLQRPGVYVTYDGRGILWTRGHRVRRGVEDRAQQAAHVVNLESRFDGPPGPRLKSFLAVLDDADLPARERRATADFNKRVGSSRPPASRDDGGSSSGRGDEDGGVSGGLAAVIGAGLVVLVAAAVVLARRRRGARPVDDRPVLPRRVFSLAREATREDLAERADAMLIALASIIDAAPPSADTQRALDAYEAAKRALASEERDVPDLVGALVCIDAGRAALSSEGELRPPCTYDPRHGPAAGPPVCVRGTDLRLCKACRADVEAGRPADVLRDGAGRPYFDADTPWAASGYGAWSDPVRAVLDTRR